MNLVFMLKIYIMVNIVNMVIMVNILIFVNLVILVNIVNSDDSREFIDFGEIGKLVILVNPMIFW